MAITFFGSAATPADNGTNTADPVVVTPPGSMTAGDLVVLVGSRRANSGTLAISEAGGQVWTALTQQNDNTLRVCYFWCIYNGNWSANPSVSTGATLCNSAVMLVFRPDSNYAFVPDLSLVSGAFTAPGSPYTVTITGGTIATGAVAIASWHNSSAITYGSLAGAGWSKTNLTAQYRNTSGSDQTMSFAYYIGSGATGDVSQNESAGTAGNKNFLAFKEEPTWTVNVSQAVGCADQTPTVSVGSSDLLIDKSGVNAQAVGAADQTPSLILSTAQVNVSQPVGAVDQTALVSTSAPQINQSQAIGVAEPSFEESFTAEISASDSVGVADTPTVAVESTGDLEITTSASLSISESAPEMLVSSSEVNVSEPVGAGEVTPGLQVSSAEITLTEPIGAGDTLIQVEVELPTLEVNQSQAIGITEPPFVVSSIPEIEPSESLSVADSATLTVEAIQINVSQAMGVSEDPTVTAGGLETWEIIVTEPIGVAESSLLTVSDLQLTTSQPVGITESATEQVAVAIWLSQPISVSESLSPLALTAEVNVSQSVGAADQPAVGLTSDPQIITSQPVAVSDEATVNASGDLIVNPNQPLSVAENIGLDLSVAQILASQGVAVGETPLVAVGSAADLNLSLTETIHVTEPLFVGSAILTLTVSQPLSVTETPGLTLTLAALAVAEAVHVSETPNVQAGGLPTLIPSVTDSVSVAESATATVATASISLLQPIGVSDSASLNTSAPQINTNQPLGVTESTPALNIGTPGGLLVTVSQAIGHTESVAASVSTALVTVSQPVQVTETAGENLKVTRAASQPVSLTETATVWITTAQVQVSQPIGVTETATEFLPQLYVSVTSSIGVAETGVPYWAGDLFILVGETIHIQDLGQGSFFGVVPGTPEDELAGWRNLGMQEFRPI